MSLSAVCRTMFAFLLLLAATAASGQTVFPGKEWQVDKPEAQSMSSEGLEKVGAWLKANGSKTGMVVRHGRIVGQWYFDDAQPDSKFPVYSTTKSFASTATGLAIAAGKLTLDSKVGEFFPEAKPPEKREITVRQLLSMTSGAHSDNMELKRSDLFRYVLEELPMDHPPGQKWEYNNTGLSLLSPVVQKRCVNTTAPAAFGPSSPAFKSRPNTGRRPITSKYEPSTTPARTVRGSPRPTIVNVICENSPIAVTDFSRPRRSMISGTENA